MKKTYAVLVALAGAATLISSPSSAADLRMATKAPVVAAMAPAPTWQGFYIGAFGGYGWGDLHIRGVGTIRDTKEGGFGGGLIGYNFQAPGSNWVFGIEADAAGSSTDAFGTVRGRVGYAFGNVLAYGTGGYAWGNFRLRSLGLTEDRTASGYAVGGGLEYAFAPNWSAKVEYLYLDFADQTYFGTDRVRLDGNTIKAGVNYRFNFGAY